MNPTRKRPQPGTHPHVGSLSPALAGASTSPPAFSEIYTRHFGFVWSVAHRFGVRAIDLDDVVQEVFIVVHRQLPTFEHRSRLQTWLASITRKVAWRHRRGRDRAQRKLDALRMIDDDDDGFSFVRGAAIESLDRFVQGLPRESREVFVLSELHGLRGPEIAEATGSKLNTVYARVRTTRQRFERWCADQQSLDAPPKLLERARQQAQPPRRAADRVWGLLAVRLDQPAVTATAVGTAGAATSAATNLKVFVLTVALGGVGLWAARTAVPSATTTSTRAQTQRPVHEASHERSRRGGRGGVDRAAVSPVDDGRSGARPVAGPRPSGGAAAAIGARTSVPAGGRPSAERARPGARPSSPATGDAPRPKPTVQPAAGLPGDPLVRERAMIAAARAAVARDPTAALDRLEAHAAQFPDGVLVRERTRLHMRALCRLGRPQDARSLVHTPSDAALFERECSGWSD